MVLLRLSTHVVAWTALHAVKVDISATHCEMVDTPCKIMVLLRLGMYVVAEHGVSCNVFRLGRGCTHTHVCALGVTRSSGAM